MIVRVVRSDGARSWEQAYEVEAVSGMTVLDALLYVQDNLDPTLSFRYSCHWAVCGSCAMLINGIPRLACRTLLSKAGEGPELSGPPLESPRAEADEVRLAPLPHLPVIKDLVVDQRGFFAKDRAVRPFLEPAAPDPEEERTLSPADAAALDRYASCILCAACHGACPVAGTSKDYLGPAALAKLYRFAIDPREGKRRERVASADGARGWQGCRFFTNCRKVCPRRVPPDEGIAVVRRELGRDRP